MKAYILSTGDEVLLGDIIDTNSAFLCRALKDLGIDVQKIVAVEDDVDIIASNISDISLQAQICIVTGGLGPTRDDLTAFACNKAAGDRLETNPQALESMRSYFKKQGFQLTRQNEKQALQPSKAALLINDNGTAPGFYIKINQCLFFFLPGVPSEMELMFENQVKKILIRQFKLTAEIFIERLTIFGLSESKVGVLLNGFSEKFPNMRLGFRARFPVIEVKIRLSERLMKKEKARTDIAGAKQWAMLQLGHKVVSDQGLSIAEEVGRLLTDQKKTLAIAESCTGGLIANMVTDVAGSSNYFLFSGVTYSNNAKMNVLDVQEKTIVKYGAVHEQTAIEMAQGARHKAGSDYAVATTGIAGPGGGSAEKPVGMVCIGISGHSFSKAKTYRFSFDDRLKHKKIFAVMALELLRRQLISKTETL